MKLHSPRVPSRFSDCLRGQLNMYALAAGAAGVGALASAQPAQAKVIYYLANIPVVENGNPVQLDLNHDGIVDFGLSNVYTTDAVRPAEGFHQSSMNALPAQAANRVQAVRFKETNFEAAAIPEGKTIGPDNLFQPGQSAMVLWDCAGGTSGGGCGGAWLKVQQAYLGLKFTIKGETHYGWAHVRFSSERAPTIVGYAYETVPNKAIVAGDLKHPEDGVLKPATLGRLALGR
ncbi:MAG TPA: hypothetical protein VF753_15640 [Terriglobales bacterium]